MEQIDDVVARWPSRRKTKGIQRWGGSRLEVVSAYEAEDGHGTRRYIGAARRAWWPWWRSNAEATVRRGEANLEKGARPEGERGEGGVEGE